MMWGYHDGQGWWMLAGILMMLVFWLGIAVVLYFLSGSGLVGRRRRDGEEAIDLLNRRLAAGEINESEYDRIRERFGS